MRWIKFLLSIAVSFTLFFLLNFSTGKIPPPGKFLNPFGGFWKNNTASDKIPALLDVSGLKDMVLIRWDERRVPHIFANNDYDLYFAQGYLTARDRLWQMDFQTRAAAGQISEIVGEKAVEFDRFRRRIGMGYAAEKALAKMLRNTETHTAIQAYADGVNAYIHSLSRNDYAVEYKILNYAPEEWTPLKSALLLKYMAWDLTGYYIKDQFLTQAVAVMNKAEIERLYPCYPPFTEPIIPAGTSWDFTTIINGKPASSNTPVASGQTKIINSRSNSNPINHQIYNLEPQTLTPNGFFTNYIPPKSGLDFLTSTACQPALQILPEISIGSNNWAVSGKLTAGGFSILCNDPHLRLTLPSTWYEIQLISPSKNVYGVTLPGAPSVIIGFNSKIAWGLTNAETDVIDWYEVKFKDQSKSAYLHDDEWKPTTFRIEEIKIRGEESVFDTVYYTHHGPLVYHTNEKSFNNQIPVGTAMRWTAHDSSNELLTFLQLNRARNYDDYVEALSHFDCPGQNFAFAAAEGDIAIQHNGKFPIRPPGQGRTINNGRNSDTEWQGWIPMAHLPHIKNPERGFVSSANQCPATPDYPYALCGNYSAFMRSTRINEHLAKLKSITAQDMIAFQHDVLCLLAQKVLPLMLAALDKNQLDNEETMALTSLQKWNYEYRADLIAPTIFRYWWRELSRLTWNDEVEFPKGKLPIPRRDITLMLILNDPESPYFDRYASPQKENFRDIAAEAFQLTIKLLQEKFGNFGNGWIWGKARATDIFHLAQIPGLGRTKLSTNGDFGVVNATGRHHGPSWRMVVELGKSPKAWGIYPGGQSGNPGSRFYDFMVDDWVAGKMYELIYLESPDNTHNRIVAKTVMK